MPPDPHDSLICSVFLALAAAGPRQCLEPPVALSWLVCCTDCRFGLPSFPIRLGWLVMLDCREHSVALVSCFHSLFYVIFLWWTLSQFSHCPCWLSVIALTCLRFSFIFLISAEVNVLLFLLRLCISVPDSKQKHSPHSPDALILTPLCLRPPWLTTCILSSLECLHSWSCCIYWLSAKSTDRPWSLWARLLLSWMAIGVCNLCCRGSHCAETLGYS